MEVTYNTKFCIHKYLFNPCTKAMCEFKFAFYLGFVPTEKLISHLKIQFISCPLQTVSQQQKTPFVIRTITELKVTCVTVVTVKQQRVLLQEGDWECGDSEHMECEVLTAMDRLYSVRY